MGDIFLHVNNAVSYESGDLVLYPGTKVRFLVKQIRGRWLGQHIRPEVGPSFYQEVDSAWVATDECVDEVVLPRVPIG